jgi:hypothetical protein
MSARLLMAFLAAMTLVFAPVAEALAAKSGSFSSGGSRSSSSGSRSGSSGWSSSSKPSTPAPASPGAPAQPSGAQGQSGWSSGAKPAAPATPATPPPAAAPAPSAPAQSQATPGGWSNTSGAAATGGAAKTGGTSAFSAAGGDAVRKQAATTSYQGYQGLYSKQGNAVPGQVGTNQPILNQNRTFGSYKDYNGYRDNYYAGRGWSAPGYAFGSFSSFGMWDAMFMWFMLSNLTSGAGFFHNRQSDPGVQAFQKEAAKLSESNAELKKQLDEMNAKLDQMKKDGVPVDPNAVPKDVDTNVALAQPKIAQPAAPEKKDSSSGFLWPVMGLVAAGAAAWFIFGRRRTA